MKTLSLFSLMLFVLLNVQVKSEVVRGYLQLQESESLWVPSWLEGWLELDDYLAEGFAVVEFDAPLLGNIYETSGTSAKNQSLIIDGQAYLSEELKGSLETIIKRHSELSVLPLRIYIFGSEQSVEVPMKQLYKKAWGDTKGVTVIYYMGQPLRSEGYVSIGAGAEVREVEMQELFSKSGRKANEYGAIDEQLFTCIDEVSKRLFWIQKEYEAQLNLKPNKVVADETLAEIEEIEDIASKPEGIKEKVASWKDELTSIGAWVLPTLVGFVVSCILLAIWLLIRKNRPLCYPERLVKPRLSAEHGALTGEMIKFKHINESLSDQKNKLTISEL